MKRARNNWGKTRQQCPSKGTTVTQLQPMRRILNRTELWVCGVKTEDDTDAISFTPVNEHIEVVTMCEALKVTTNRPLYQMSWRGEGGGKEAWYSASGNG